MSQGPDEKLLNALAGLDADADLRVVQRTRRAVMAAANRMRETQRRGRYQIGLVLLALGAVLMFLTPTLWVIAEDVSSGEHWLDEPALTGLLIATTVSTIFALVVGQLSGRSRGESA